MKSLRRLALPLLLLALAPLPPLARAADPVAMTLAGAPAKPGDYTKDQLQDLTLTNGLLTLVWGKDFVGDYSVTSLTKNGTELAHNLKGVEPRDVDRGRTFYLDYNAGKGHLVVDAVRIIENTPEIAHIALIDKGESSIFPIEHHIIMRPGESGIFGYVILKEPLNNNGPTWGINEMRTMYRFDRDILDWAYNSERMGQQPKYADLMKLPRIQDETWQLPDGYVYQKYDYCGYFAETPMWGHLGHGFGAFYIPVSTEYYDNMPLRQELIIHQDALILNYIQGGHLGARAARYNKGDVKLFGPWFLYINSGPSNEAIVADAKQKVSALQSQWPFTWVNEPLYPLKRATVTGHLQLSQSGEKKDVAGATVVLGKPNSAATPMDLYYMGGGYTFLAKTDAKGNFSMPNVRPGNYTLYAYANSGPITDQFEVSRIIVEDHNQDLGELTWTPPNHGKLLWQIGDANRMSSEFKFGNELRNIQWGKKVPPNLTYTIGQSKPAEDWYFAQTKPGTWTVNFNLPELPSADATLTLAIAGSDGGQLDIAINESPAGHLTTTKDAALYRSAIRGAHYQLKTLKIPLKSLKQGPNALTLTLTAGDIIWDTLLLEAP